MLIFIEAEEILALFISDSRCGTDHAAIIYSGDFYVIAGRLPVAADRTAVGVERNIVGRVNQLDCGINRRTLICSFQYKIRRAGAVFQQRLRCGLDVNRRLFSRTGNCSISRFYGSTAFFFKYGIGVTRVRYRSGPDGTVVILAARYKGFPCACGSGRRKLRNIDLNCVLSGRNEDGLCPTFICYLSLIALLMKIVNRISTLIIRSL